MKPRPSLQHPDLRAAEVLGGCAIDVSGQADRLPLARLSFLTPLTFAAFAASPTVAQVRLEAPRDIANLLSPFLPAEAEIGSRNKLQALLGEILATEGYFSPKIEFFEDQGPLRVRIDPVPRTKIASVDLSVDGAVEQQTRASLLAGWKLPVGQPFRQSDWNTAKQDVLAALLAKEHATAKLLDNALGILYTLTFGGTPRTPGKAENPADE